MKRNETSKELLKALQKVNTIMNNDLDLSDIDAVILFMLSELKTDFSTLIECSNNPAMIQTIRQDNARILLNVKNKTHSVIFE